MPGFFSEFGPALREREDRQLTHLKSMCSILAMIEYMGAGDTIEIAAVNQPASDGIYWSIRRMPITSNRTEPPVEAHKLIMREIEDRTDHRAWDNFFS